MIKSWKWTATAAAGALLGATAFTSSAMAFGEAGPITLSEMGHFFVGVDVTEAEDGSARVSGQSYVGFAIPAEPQFPNPVVLIHGGGGQSADWFSTVDGRDGWRSYLLANGVETYWIDRPGLGRSPANPSYGDGTVGWAPAQLLAGLASSEVWPGAEPVEGEFTREGWVELNAANEGVINWMAGTPGGPYGGNDLATANIIELVEEIGPAVLFAHSAGVASTLTAAIGAPEGAVQGVLVFEGGVDLLNETNRNAATWEPPLPEGFEPVEVDGCMLQPEDSVSQNVSLQGIPFTIIRAEHGNQSDEQFACSVRQLQQMGVDAKYIQMADNGFPGGGHFAMSDTNSGEIATELLLPILNDLMGVEELPADWTVVQ